MIKINNKLKPQDLQSKLTRFWELSADKIKLINKLFDTSKGAPVFTVKGKYTSRGWTEWTQGFQFGSAILQFDASAEKKFLESGRQSTIDKMTPHVSHTGVHDHGFNNISTYGNLLRLMTEGKIPYNEYEKEFYKLALKVSAAVQASRWTKIKDGGFIYSFNGPHSLFVDTIRSCRILMLAHAFGHYLPGENDLKISLLDRAIQHLLTTAKYSIFYGDKRDIWDIRGRTAHECIFNTNDGNYRCPNSQQGYSGFTTWTRGLAWAMLGFAEELEFIDMINEDDFIAYGGKTKVQNYLLEAAKATCDFYIEFTPGDGIPYWDTGAPGLKHLNNYLDKSSDPFNNYEPVDSSAAAIGAQGLLRLGRYLSEHGDSINGKKYFQAGLTTFNTLLEEPYLSTDNDHQGLILHSVYHQPNGWDYIPEGSAIPYGEATMWGDYHARELALYVQRIANNELYYTFFNSLNE